MDMATATEIIKPLKGAPLSVFVILLLYGGTMTNVELQVSTGYGDEPVTRATQYLELRQAIRYNGKNFGWSIRQFEQLPLPFKQLAAALTKLSTGYPQNSKVDPVFPDQLPPPPPYIEESKRGVAEGGEGSGDVPGFTDQLSGQQDVFDICRQFGVGAKKAKELAQLPWATASYAASIFNQYKRREYLTPRNRIAYAIQAISDHDDPRSTDDTCEDCGRTINPRLNFCAHCAVNN